MERRARSESSLRRTQGRKKSSPRILIVCEGEKTERSYFNAIRRERRLSGARVQILPSDYGTDPLSVVNYALDKFLAEGRAFDEVYAVFDRDDHHTYNNALDRASPRSTTAIRMRRASVSLSRPSHPCRISSYGCYSISKAFWHPYTELRFTPN